jgi:hypothetical protein
MRTSGAMYSKVPTGACSGHTCQWQPISTSERSIQYTFPLGRLAVSLSSTTENHQHQQGGLSEHVATIQKVVVFLLHVQKDSPASRHVSGLLSSAAQDPVQHRQHNVSLTIWLQPELPPHLLGCASRRIEGARDRGFHKICHTKCC